MSNLFFAENHTLLNAYPYDENYNKNMIQLLLMMLTMADTDTKKAAIAKQFNFIIEKCNIYEIPGLLGIRDTITDIPDISEYSQVDFNGDIAYIPTNADDDKPDYNTSRYDTYISTLKKSL